MPLGRPAAGVRVAAQGRNIGVGAIAAINLFEFLVLERDNRGVGIDDPTGTLPVGTKRIYKIDIRCEGKCWHTHDTASLPRLGLASVVDGTDVSERQNERVHKGHGSTSGTPPCPR